METFFLESGVHRRLLASLLSTALVLSACGGTPDTAAPADRGTTGTAPPASQSPDRSADGRATTGGSPDGSGPETPAGQDHAALAFEAPLIQGGTFDGAVSGDVVVWFWAPW